MLRTHTGGRCGKRLRVSSLPFKIDEATLMRPQHALPYCTRVFGQIGLGVVAGGKWRMGFSSPPSVPTTSRFLVSIPAKAESSPSAAAALEVPAPSVPPPRAKESKKSWMADDPVMASCSTPGLLVVFDAAGRDGIPNLSPARALASFAG
ncbi:hypothetical protein CPLU01_00490 [Colletotrichum plurivorum]|uniref:Uncharacterized protein n=1 Tax=Colletotrichum plurivorum TaxID=2175906 RepID=A0A8H6NS00_9PEZI|nr:hypothetical protein CPLU01_00490 [Colletotrichum plurivorum]